ncbi:MAG: ATP cone domain-containing protein, partial [Candidatus Dormibacteraceae bacterium]
MPTEKVVKRTGDLVAFDRGRIEHAIGRAVEAAQEKLDAKGRVSLVDRIVAELDDRFLEFYPNVENIQDVVEKHLMRQELYNTAKVYILYRAEHRKQREMSRQHIVEAARRGRLTVTTGEGGVALFNLRKVEEAVARAAHGLADISVHAVVEEAVKGAYDGMPTVQVERALIMAAAAMIEREPAYSWLAARLQLDSLFREVTGESPASPLREDLARSAFVIGIRNGVR